MTAAARAVDDEVGYRLVLPPGWVRLPMDPVGMRTAARAWLLTRARGLPRDTTATARRTAEDELVALTHRKGAEHSRMLLVLSLQAQGRPVSASCLVSCVPVDLSGEGALASLQSARAPGSVLSEVADLGRNRGVVVVRDEVLRPSEVSGGGAVDGQRVAELGRRFAAAIGLDTDDPAPQAQWEPGLTRGVDVHLPVPDTAQTLLMSFSTPLPPLFEPFTELFVLMASSVQWRRRLEPWA